MAKGDKLAAKQAAFVHEYLIDLNATQAALRAGYSARRAREIGYQLLRVDKVQAAIDRAMKRREQRTEITQDMVLRELAKIAMVDIKDFLEFGPEEVIEGVAEDGTKAIRIKSAVMIKPSKDVDGTLLAEVKQTPAGISVKPHDRMKALELLGKHLRMFGDVVEHTGNVEVVFNIPRPPATDQVPSETEDGDG